MNSRRKRREKISEEKSGIDGKKERLIFSLDISSHTFYAVFDFPPPASTNFSWVSEDCDSLDQLSLSIGVRAILSWICQDSAQFQKETWKIKRSLVVNVLQAADLVISRRFRKVQWFITTVLVGARPYWIKIFLGKLFECC